MNDIATLLKTFADAHGMSGYEDDVAALLLHEMEPLMDEVRIDTMGNAVGIRAGAGPSVMIAAHMDEIGAMISHIEDSGFLRFVPVGGWYDATILGQRVLIRTKEGKILPGVVGSRPPHVMDAEERKKTVKIKDMFIDCGATSAQNAGELGVEIGSTVTIDRELLPMGNDFVTGKALDNRAGVVMMVWALRLLKRKKVKATIQAVGTVQEEVGLKGARTSAYDLTPDVAIATDVTIPGDNPGVSRSESRVAAGAGPSITIIDAAGRGVMSPPSVIRWLRETADKAEIPYQLQVGNGGHTDATAISITKSGIPCGVVTVPTRYIHSPVEVLSLRDLELGGKLIAAAIESVHRYF
jgi:putative aminopeptidase FrvX